MEYDCSPTPRRPSGRDQGVPRQHRGPTAFIEAVEVVRDNFGLYPAGDGRGPRDDHQRPDLRDPCRHRVRPGLANRLGHRRWKTLASQGGPLQFDPVSTNTDLAEITHPDYPGERLIACRNPFLATERARKRGELLQASEDSLAPLVAAVAARAAGRWRTRWAQGRQDHQAGPGDGQTPRTSPSPTPRWSSPAKPPRSPPRPPWTVSMCFAPRCPPSCLDAAGVVTAYKNLANVERDFRPLKVDDLDPASPVFHRLEDRVRAHVLIVRASPPT